jgi:hypothetical protein
MAPRASDAGTPAKSPLDSYRERETHDYVRGRWVTGGDNPKRPTFGSPVNLNACDEIWISAGGGVLTFHLL